MEVVVSFSFTTDVCERGASWGQKRHLLFIISTKPSISFCNALSRVNFWNRYSWFGLKYDYYLWFNIVEKLAIFEKGYLFYAPWKLCFSCLLTYAFHSLPQCEIVRLVLMSWIEVLPSSDSSPYPPYQWMTHLCQGVAFICSCLH